MRCTTSMNCQAPRFCRMAAARPRYSRASSVACLLGLRLVDDGALDPQRPAGPDRAGADAHPGDAAHDGSVLAAGEPADLLDDGERADRE